MLRLFSCPGIPTLSTGVDPALGLQDSSDRHVPPAAVSSTVWYNPPQEKSYGSE